MGYEQRLPQRIKKAVKRLHLVGIPMLFFGRILSGYRVYKKLLLQTSEAGNRYFMDYGGSGDTWLCCCMLRQYGRISGEDVFVASGIPSAKIASCFDFGRVIRISQQAAFNIRMLERFNGAKLRLAPLLYESEPLKHSGVLRNMWGHNRLHFLDLLRIGMELFLGIPYGDMQLEQPRLPYETGDVDEVFQRSRLAEGRTVLLAPYAGRHDMLDVPMSLYEGIAKQLKERGFTVCTNSGSGRDEPAVPGTIPIFLPYHLMLPFCERAGYFIGIRSGLCDLISAARMRGKVIFYTNYAGWDGIGTTRDFYSLKIMGLCDDAVEIEVQTSEPQAVIPQITQIVVGSK